ncbi:hypothetical protein KUCAC02_012896 [Chaenocephalus aceratus]|uniref:Uncharacterized protein n=1 Tax=Chaenocephalus aceratus TaxID=36190 RepID=A0ACB9XE14_CHAAC|nr:hypothetical protein KUCAC02_012896 [Chaenocephalus aceratus]
MCVRACVCVSYKPQFYMTKAKFYHKQKINIPIVNILKHICSVNSNPHFLCP